MYSHSCSRKGLLFLFLGLCFGLIAGFANVAHANFLSSATTTVSCTDYTISVDACQLTAGSSYTIDYTIEPSCAANISGSNSFTAKTTTNGTTSCPNNTFSETITASPSPPFPLTGSCFFSGMATLVGHNTIGINFKSNPISCPAVCTAGVSNSGSMEGNLPVKSGDNLKAGFDFTIPGSHPADVVNFSNVTLSLPVQCPNGSSTTLVVHIPNQSFNVPANNNQWFPSGDQNSPLVYQGSITVPPICGGATGHAPQGATFKASLTASTKNSIHVRFHYSDDTAGSWSSTQSYCQ